MGGVVEAAIFIGDTLGLIFLLVAEIIKLAYRLWNEWKALQDG